MRVITPSGSAGDTYSSQYKINDRAVTVDAYIRRLETYNILVKARNFLVFQVRGGWKHWHGAGREAVGGREDMGVQGSCERKREWRECRKTGSWEASGTDQELVAARAMCPALHLRTCRPRPAGRHCGHCAEEPQGADGAV